MGRRVSLPRVLWVVGLLLSTVVTSRSEVGGSVSTDFKVEVRSAYELDAGWMTNWVWSIGTNEFWIAPIPHWNLNIERVERRLEVVNTNGTCVITLSHSVLTNTPTAEDFRRIVAKRHQGFKLVRELELNSGCGSAAVFDLLLAEEGERTRPAMAAWRTALIVHESSLLECTLRTSLRAQPDLLRTFGRFLVGLRLPPPEDASP